MLDDDGLGADVEDATLVELDDAQDLAPLRFGGAHLDERQLVLDHARLGQVLDLEHVDEPVELLAHLLDGEVVKHFF